MTSGQVHNRILFYILLLTAALGCKSNKQPQLPPLFQVLNSKTTGLNFTNQLTPTEQFNVFHYMYFYNGAGIGAADFNNDGKIDLFFASNQGKDKLFLNEGNMHFKEVTDEAHIPNDGGWSTGVSVVDINNDGLLDLYICRVGKYEVLNSHNQFLICTGIDKNGVPQYKDEAAAMGLDFSGFSTQTAFIDYDMDGDLDMYLLNHSIHQNGTYGPRAQMLENTSPVSGDHLYRNDGNGKFTDVTKSVGINSSVLGYGLGVCVSDINMDGYPDMYVSNDFHEDDYLYINQRNGTFKDEDTTCLMHTSQYSMGVDVADVNNDAYPEIITMDMLSNDPYILKRSLGEDAYDIFNMKVDYGYTHQYTRNNLQLNNHNGMFSEAGLYAGIAATDWSWSPLWMDFNNDGFKDLFISNGIPKRLNDIDYVNFVSSLDLQEKLRTNTLNKKDLSLVDKFPQIKIPNKLFTNKGNLQFADLAGQIGGDVPTFSNGAIYADLDGDGDLDIVVNNIDDAALIYQNKSNDVNKKSFMDIKLKGTSNNINALGAKMIVYTDSGIRTYEKYPVHGFLSSMEVPLHIGLSNARVDSMLLVWNDNTYEKIDWQRDTMQTVTFTYKSGLPHFDYAAFAKRWQKNTFPVKNITAQTRLNYKHVETPFVEFDREPLMPHMVSREGPALAIGDINGDGSDDVFIGASKRAKGAVFIQNAVGKFERISQPALDKDSMWEDVDAVWLDVNGDKYPDLVVASGGNEYFGSDEHLLPRVYLNDGKGNLTRKMDAFSNVYMTASCVAPCDINGDGYPDLFIGGRAVPWNYGVVPKSYLLLNDGTGRFKDVTATYAKDLSQVGFVTGGVWCDIDKDGDKDLLLSLEWDGIVAFINNNGHFTRKYLTEKKGWWNFVLPVDIDGDGDVDLIAGNLGLNSRLKATDAQPIRMYYNDFDNNGTKEQILTYYLNGKELVFANKEELQRQMPTLKKQFLYAEDFAKASLADLFPQDKLDASNIFTANYFFNAVLINNGNLNYTVQAMPCQAQLSPYRDATIIDANGDSLPDILLFGNYDENNIEMGRYDADFGTILLNQGNHQFAAEGLNGLQVKGEVRHVQDITIGGKKAYLLARNNDSTMVIQFEQPPLKQYGLAKQRSVK
jgi:hypothetical protein